MQEKFEPYEIFLRRTDELAHRMGLSLEEMPPALGMSRASFFGYRSGKRPISSKAWAKLKTMSQKYQRDSYEGSVVSAHEVEYKVKPIIQSVADAAKNASVEELLGKVSDISRGVIHFPASMRAKIMDDMITMMLEAKRKNDEQVNEL